MKETIVPTEKIQTEIRSRDATDTPNSEVASTDGEGGLGNYSSYC